MSWNAKLGVNTAALQLHNESDASGITPLSTTERPQNSYYLGSNSYSTEIETIRVMRTRDLIPLSHYSDGKLQIDFKVGAA